MKAIISTILVIYATSLTFGFDQERVVFLYTNDLHGWVLPFDYQFSNAEFNAKESVDAGHSGNNLGGLARRASKIYEIRRSSSDPVVLTDSGDLFYRGPWQQYFQGTIEIDAYNLMNYDVVCVGNNDLRGTGVTSSKELLVELVKKSKFSWVCANLAEKDSRQQVAGIQSYIIKQFGSLKIGFLGLTSISSNYYSQIEGWAVEDPIKTAKSIVPELRKECDVVVALTHIGFSLDRELGASVSGIDLIIGGHSHTFIDDVYFVQNPDDIPIPIVQAGAYGVALGELVITFEKDDQWKIKELSNRLLKIDSTVTDDEKVKNAVDYEIDHIRK